MDLSGERNHPKRKTHFFMSNGFFFCGLDHRLTILLVFIFLSKIWEGFVLICGTITNVITLTRKPRPAGGSFTSN
jgi:hypothetical protein